MSEFPALLEAFLKTSKQSPLQVCDILSTQDFKEKCRILNRFYKLPVGQASSLDEEWSFGKLWGYQLSMLSSKLSARAPETFLSDA